MPDSAALSRLVARAQDGEARAFEDLVAEHVAQVRRFARAFARDDADADDLAQDALVKVYRSIRSYRFQAAFSTWLYTVVRNVFLDAAKSRAGKERAMGEPLRPRHAERLGSVAAADEQVVVEEERRRVWRAIERLGAEFRTAVVLCDIEGLSYDEVAAVERVAVGTVKSRLHRGRAELRRLLEPQVVEFGNSRAAAVVPREGAEPS